MQKLLRIPGIAFLAVFGVIILFGVGVVIYNSISSRIAVQREAAQQDELRRKVEEHEAAMKRLSFKMTDRQVQMASRQYKQMLPVVAELAKGSLSDHGFERGLLRFIYSRFGRL